MCARLRGGPVPAKAMAPTYWGREGNTMFEHVVAAAFVASDEKPYGVLIESGSHALRADEPARHGGGDSGPSPFGLLLSGLGPALR
jgi:hypothetical protein